LRTSRSVQRVVQGRAVTIGAKRDLGAVFYLHLPSRLEFLNQQNEHKPRLVIESQPKVDVEEAGGSEAAGFGEALHLLDPIAIASSPNVEPLCAGNPEVVQDPSSTLRPRRSYSSARRADLWSAAARISINSSYRVVRSSLVRRYHRQFGGAKGDLQSR